MLVNIAALALALTAAFTSSACQLPRTPAYTPLPSASIPREAVINAELGSPPSFEEAKQVATVHMQDTLIDAASAQVKWSNEFKDIYNWTFRSGGKADVYAFWFEINSKNRMGGYTGYKTAAVLFRAGHVVGYVDPTTTVVYGRTVDGHEKTPIEPIPIAIAMKPSVSAEPLMPAAGK